MNLRIKTEPVITAGADATVNVWFLGQMLKNKSWTYNVAFAPDASDSVFMPRLRIILGQCIGLAILEIY